jgi:hypothetical protein
MGRILRRCRRNLVVALGLVACGAVLGSSQAPSAHAGVDAAAGCKDAKAKAAGKQAGDMLKALGKNVKQPDPVKLGQSLSKAESKITKAFVKAEGKGGCVTLNDVDDIEASVQAFVADVNATVSPPGPQPDESASGNGTATTDDEGDGATPGDHVETTVTDPGGGFITINETTTLTVTPPPGFTLIDTQSDITITGSMPPPTAADPYVLLFRLDSSLESAVILTGLELLDVHVFQYDLPSSTGQLVDPCTGDGAKPDPCVRRTFDPVQNDVVLTVYTTTASIWAFGTPLGSPDDCCTALDPQTITFSFEGTGTCGILRNFRCMGGDAAFQDNPCVEDSDCDFGTCAGLLCAGDPDIDCSTDADCQGTCDEVFSAPPNELPRDLNCGSLYLGGGGNSVPLPIVLPGIPTSVTDVTSCGAGSGVLTLGPKTAAETGSGRTCTSGRECSGSGAPCVLDSDCPASQTCDRPCLFGAPIPVPNVNTPPTSACAVLDVETDASGTATCNGDVDLSLPVRMDIFLNGDLFTMSTPPNIPGPQPCPLCVKQCVGGSNDQFPCDDDFDCIGGVCGASTVCMGGPNDGIACTPESIALGTSYRTSHDCPSEPSVSLTTTIGGVPLDLALTTAQVTRNAADLNIFAGGQRVFCGYCRDSDVEGTLCFEGDTNAACPAAGDLNAVRCSSDADCSAPYESCAQRTPGAFSRAAATHISLTGKPAPPSLGGDSRLVSSFCVPPMFSPVVDAAADWPGPGAVMLQGEVTLSP